MNHKPPALSLPLPLPLLLGLLVVALLLPGGCANRQPTEFHTLMAPAAAASSTGAAGAAADSGLRFRIESPVRVPPQVDQPQVVLRRPDGSLQALEEQRWVAPLADEWRDAIADGLARRLGALDVSRMAAPAGGPSPYVLQLELQRFDSTAGGQVLQQAQWSVRRPGDTAPALVCVSTLQAPAGGSVAEVAAAHRRVVERLVELLASSVRGLQDAHAAACPQGF
jgi:uncharacterized lipoprotein YmbA